MAHALWIREPIWTAESPGRLYALFRAYAAAKGKLPAAEDDEFTRLLMAIVDMQFRQHRVAKMLGLVRVSAEDVAQEAVMHLRRKCVWGMGLRPAEYGDAWKVMISAMNVAIYRFVLTEVGRGKRRHWRESTATDHHARHQLDDRIAGILDAAGPGQGPTAGGLVRSLVDAEDDIIGDLIGNAEDAARFESLFKAVVAQVCTQRSPTPHAGLPPALQEVPREIHLLIVSRVLWIVRDYAAA